MNYNINSHLIVCPSTKIVWALNKEREKSQVKVSYGSMVLWDKHCRFLVQNKLSSDNPRK